MKRWILTLAVRLGPLVAGLHTAPPWFALKLDRTPYGLFLAVHLGVIERRRPGFREPPWWETHATSATSGNGTGRRRHRGWGVRGERRARG